MAVKGCTHDEMHAGSELLLGSHVGAVTALSLSAVGGFQWKSGVAFSANFLITIELFSDGGDSWIHHTSS